MSYRSAYCLLAGTGWNSVTSRNRGFFTQETRTVSGLLTRWSDYTRRHVL